jgi:hypothetical protein
MEIRAIHLPPFAVHWLWHPRFADRDAVVTIGMLRSINFASVPKSGGVKRHLTQANLFPVVRLDVHIILRIAFSAVSFGKHIERSSSFCEC